MRRRPRWSWIALLSATLMAAPGACTPAPAPAPTAEPSATSTVPQPSSTPAGETGPFFNPVSPDPVFSRDPGAWYADAVEPGAVVAHEGRFLLFFNGTAGWPAPNAVGLAVSPNGQDWTVAPTDPLLDSARVNFQGFTFFASSVVVLADGTWVMYLYTLDEGRDGAPGVILAATSPAPEGPWELLAEPVLRPGPEGAWDEARVTQPSVIPTDSGYAMYFAGANNDRLRAVRMIGLATSTDGLTWVKHNDPATGGPFEESDPVLPTGEAGDWDAHRVFQPHVVRTPEGLLMLYKANIQVGRDDAYGFAMSADGLEWTKWPKNPMITSATYPVEWRRNGYTELIYEGGTLYLFLEILEREGGTYPQGNTRYFSNIYLAAHEGLP